MNVKSIVLGCDNLALDLKNAIKEMLNQKDLKVGDVGVDTKDAVDYPDIAIKLTSKITSGEYERGILFCGSGAGMAIAANKVKGIRAVCVGDAYSAQRSIASNNAQVITMGSLITGVNLAKMLVNIYLENEFQGGNSARKVEKLNALDEHRK